MNYNVLLQSVFETPEMADLFFSKLMKKLNEKTTNGKQKIESVWNVGKDGIGLILPAVDAGQSVLSFSAKEKALELHIVEQDFSPL